MAEVLNQQLSKEAQRISADGADQAPYAVGDWIWVFVSKDSGLSKLDTLWIGPGEVIKRVGKLSYQVLLKPGVTHDVHMDQLKPYTGD